MTPQMKDYWMRILAAFFLLKMASTLVRDAEKMMAQSLRAKDDEVAAALNGHPVAGGSFSVWPDPDDPPLHAEYTDSYEHSYSSLTGDGPNPHHESPSEDQSLEDEGEVINLNTEDENA